MSSKHLLARFMVGVFTLSICASAAGIALAGDKAEDKSKDGKKPDVVVVALKDKPKAEKPSESPWERRPMVPSGPKF